MKTMLKIFVITLLYISVANAGEHLEPEDSLFTGLFMQGYESLVIEYLSEAKEKDVRVKVLVFPSFSAEYALGIKENNNKYFIFQVRPKIQIWAHRRMILMKKEQKRALEAGESVNYADELSELESGLPQDPMKIEKIKCKTEISSRLAESIIAVWKKMLFETKYKKKEGFGLDGTTYHFSMKVGYKNMAGKVWSPNKKSKTGKLVSLTESMSKVCDSDSSDSTENLSESVQQMVNEL